MCVCVCVCVCTHITSMYRPRAAMYAAAVAVRRPRGALGHDVRQRGETGRAILCMWTVCRSQMP